MKRNRARLIQLIAVLLAVFFILILKNQSASWRTQFLTPKPDQPFSSLKKEQIGEIILSKDKTSSIYKKGKAWYVEKGDNEFRADTDRISKIIESLVNLKKDNIVSSNKNKHKDLGIDKQKIEIKVNGKSYVIYVGSPSGLSSNYVRIGSDDEVFTADGLDETFTSDDYRDLLVHFINDETKVTSIEINFDDENALLTKKDSDWKTRDKNAKKDRIDFFIDDLKTLKARDVFPKETSLPVVISLTIKVREDSREKTIEFYPQDENNYLAKTSTSDFIFQIPAAYIASLKKEEKDFIE